MQTITLKIQKLYNKLCRLSSIKILTTTYTLGLMVLN